MSANPSASARSSSDAQAVAQAERSGRPFLVFRDGEDRQQLFFFDPGAASATIGRRSSSDLSLHWDDQVSRLHARFEREQEEDWVVVDDGISSNGTYVNDERVDGRRRLSDGDVVRFGGTTAAFYAPASRTPRPPELGAPADLTLSTTQRRVLAALCRPYRAAGSLGTAATDKQIADELVLSVTEVKRHVRVLFAKFGIEGPPSDAARLRLAEAAVSSGVISGRDL